MKTYRLLLILLAVSMTGLAKGGADHIGGLELRPLSVGVAAVSVSRDYCLCQGCAEPDEALRTEETPFTQEGERLPGIRLLAEC